MNIFARFLRSSEEKNSGKTQIFLRDILQEFRIFKGSLYYVILKWATGGKGKSAFFRRTSAHEHISVSPDTHPKKKRVTKQDKKYWRGKPWVGISYPLIREGWGKYSWVGGGGGGSGNGSGRSRKRGNWKGTQFPPQTKPKKRTFLPFQKKTLRSRTSDFFFAEKEKAIERRGSQEGEGKSGGSVKSRLLSYNLSPLSWARPRGELENWPLASRKLLSSPYLEKASRRENTKNTISEALLDTCVAPRKTIFSRIPEKRASKNS